MHRLKKPSEFQAGYIKGLLPQTHHSETVEHIRQRDLKSNQWKIRTDFIQMNGRLKADFLTRAMESRGR